MEGFQGRSTHIVASLLRLVALLVLLGLLLVWLTLLIVECLPSLTEDLANLAWIVDSCSVGVTDNERGWGTYQS